MFATCWRRQRSGVDRNGPLPRATYSPAQTLAQARSVTSPIPNTATTRSSGKLGSKILSTATNP